MVETTCTESVRAAEGARGGGLAELCLLKRQCSTADRNKWRLSSAEQLISDRARQQQQQRRGKHTPPPDFSAAKQQTPLSLFPPPPLFLLRGHLTRRSDGSWTLRTCQYSAVDERLRRTNKSPLSSKTEGRVSAAAPRRFSSASRPRWRLLAAASSNRGAPVNKTSRGRRGARGQMFAASRSESGGRQT